MLTLWEGGKMSIFKRITNIGKGVAKTTARDIGEAATEMWETMTEGRNDDAVEPTTGTRTRDDDGGRPLRREASAPASEGRRLSSADAPENTGAEEAEPTPDDRDPLGTLRKRTL